MVELIVGMFITSIIVLSTIGYFSSLAKSVSRPVIIFNGGNYSLAPIIKSNNDGVSKTDMFDAIDLNREFLRQVYASDMVAVFGGSNISASAPAPVAPLLLSFMPTSLPSIASADPAALLTANQVYAAASVDFAGYSQPTASTDNSDFTVLVFQGVHNLTAIAQVRRYTTTGGTPITYEGQAAVLYETVLYSRTLPSTTWTTYSYRFWLPLNEDVWDTPVGARHAWYRHETSWWGRSEHAGATLIFPDPYALAVVSDGESGLAPKTKSRFSYFVSTSNNY